MKVALINPKGNIFGKRKEMSEFLKKSTSMGSFRHFWSAPCLGLLTVASYLPKDWELTYIDEIYREIDFDEPYDMVCVSSMTVQAERAYEILDIYRRKGVFTILGGIHATIMPEEAKEHADVVIAGEGEVLFKQMLDDYLQGKVKRCYQQEEGGTFDLKECIPPRYDLIKEYDYPIINIYTTRGCPRKCTFCCASNVYGIRYRRKTNEEILKEIDLIQLMYPDKLLLFADDNFLILKNHSMELLKELKKRKIRWIAQADITVAQDDELLKLMHDSGCQWLVIGFESVSEKSLKNMESVEFKHKYAKNYSKYIQKIKSFGIQVYGTFIVGLDEDESSIFQATADFIMENELYGANITVPTPLPGTVLRRELEEAGRIRSNQWSDYTLWDVVIEPASMSVQELEDGLICVYKTISDQGNADKRLRSMLRGIREGARK